MLLVFGVPGGVQRQEGLLAATADAVAGDAAYLDDLEVHRPGAVGHHVVRGAVIGQVDAVGALGEQVDGRRAEQREVGGVDGAFERRFAALEQQHQLEFGAGVAAQRWRQPGQVDEQEALRQGEIFLQQAAALESAQGGGQQRLLVGVAGRADVAGVEPAVPRPGVRGGRDRQPEAGADDQLVQLEGGVVAAGQEQAQFVERQLLERDARAGAQFEPDAAAHAFGHRQRRQRQVGRKREILGRCELQRPQRDVVRGAKLADRGIALAELAAQRTAARDRHALRQVGIVRLRVEAGHQHAGCRRQEVWIDDLEQALGEARKLGVELELHPRGEEAGALEQPLDVGVGHLDAVDAEAGRDLGELAREFGAHLVQVLQFLVVVAQQARIHDGGFRRSCRDRGSARRRSRGRRRCAAAIRSAPGAPTAGREC